VQGAPRNITKFQWIYSDQTEPRYWAIYTGQLDFVPRYRYQVHVIIKGSLFTKGMDWTGPWVETSGNGPLMLTVPTPEDAGVTVKRDFPLSAAAAAPAPAPAATAMPIGPPPDVPGAPPARTGRGVPEPMTVGGYGVGVPAGAAKGGSAAGAKDVPDVSGEEEPAIAGWSTEDPTAKKGRALAYSR
jgi:hypothetical protein